MLLSHGVCIGRLCSLSFSGAKSLRLVSAKNKYMEFVKVGRNLCRNGTNKKSEKMVVNCVLKSPEETVGIIHENYCRIRKI